MSKWIGYVIFLMGIILQKLFYLYNNMQPGELKNLLLDGVAVCADIKITCSKLIFWYFPLSIIFFLCSGRARELDGGYAIMQVTRGKKRWKLIMKKQSFLILEVLLFLFLQTVLLQSGRIDIKKILLSFFLMVLTIVFFILLEFYLELYLDAMVSNCIVQVLFVFLVFMSDMVSGSNVGRIMDYFLFSCFAFAERNGISQGEMGKVIEETGILCMGIVIVVILSIRKYKNKDLIS